MYTITVANNKTGSNILDYIQQTDDQVGTSLIISRAGVKHFNNQINQTIQDIKKLMLFYNIPITLATAWGL